MDYRIGELADILGVSTETVRYYERIGLVQSHRCPDNNYRVFSIVESEHLIDMKSLQLLGFSLVEANDLLRSMDYEYGNRKLRELDERLFQDIQHIELQRDALARLIARSEKLKTAKCSCLLTTRPEYLRIPVYWERADSAMEQLRKAWITAFPFVTVSPRFRIGKDGVYCDKGLSILKTDAERIGLLVNERVQRHAAVPCIYTMVEYNQNEALPTSLFDHVRDFAVRHSLAILEEDVFGSAFAVGSNDGKKVLSVEVWVPVD